MCSLSGQCFLLRQWLSDFERGGGGFDIIFFLLKKSPWNNFFLITWVKVSPPNNIIRLMHVTMGSISAYALQLFCCNYLSVEYFSALWVDFLPKTHRVFLIENPNVYKYITGNAWVSALPKESCWFLFLSPAGYFLNRKPLTDPLEYEPIAAKVICDDVCGLIPYHHPPL